jgi:cysteine desulfurase/selenocysteine lyase
MSLTPIPTLAPLPRHAPVRPLDVGRLREDFPILRQKVHGKPLVYLDNAATTQKPQAVLDTLRHYYEHDNANVHRAAHVLSERATEAYEAARVTVQKFLHANCLREIIFTKGCTEGINLVAQTFGRMHVQVGDEVLVTWMEHHSNIVPWQLLCQEKGAQLRPVPITDAGELRLDELEKMLTPRTKMLAVVHVSNALGTINPIKHIVEIAHRKGVPVLVDGAQAVSHLPVDVQALDCDFYVFSGHKIYGPTGTGVLYGKAEHLEVMPPYQSGGDMIRTVSFEKTTWNELPYKFEAGTPNIAGMITLGAALDYVQSVGREAIAAHETHVLRYATERMAEIPGVRILGTARDKAAVISFVVEDPPLSSLDVGTKLDLAGVAVRTGHHCCQPLMDRFGIPGTARASFALYNTTEEVDTFIEALRQTVEEAGTRSRRSVAAASGSGREPDYPGAAAGSPQEASDELAEVFEFLDSWPERYQYIIELGEKLSPMPQELKTDATRVKRCQSTVYMWPRRRPGTEDVIEFLADSDADIVRGELALLQRLFSGQRARDVVAFDVQGFFSRIGLEQNLSMGRRTGLGEMIQRVRHFAAELNGKPQPAAR